MSDRNKVDPITKVIIGVAVALLLALTNTLTTKIVSDKASAPNVVGVGDIRPIIQEELEIREGMISPAELEERDARLLEEHTQNQKLEAIELFNIKQEAETIEYRKNAVKNANSGRSDILEVVKRIEEKQNQP